MITSGKNNPQLLPIWERTLSRFLFSKGKEAPYRALGWEEPGIDRIMTVFDRIENYRTNHEIARNYRFDTEPFTYGLNFFWGVFYLIGY